MADKSSHRCSPDSKRQAQKNDGVKKVSFFGKAQELFKGIGKYFKDTKSELKKVVAAQQA